MHQQQGSEQQLTSPSLWQLFIIFLTLGCTSFGGPLAHLGFFRFEFVEKRRWLSDQDYAELVALCQFLPGPASSQVGMAIGFLKRSYAGALVSFLGFTLPSFLMMYLFALYLQREAGGFDADIVHALKLVAVAVVAQALYGMSKSMCPDWPRRLFALVVMLILLWQPGVWQQLAVITMAAFCGRYFVLSLPKPAPARVQKPLLAPVLLGVFLSLLLLLPLLAAISDHGLLNLIDKFYRAGSLVFGGGHVVLPMLQAELVPDLIDNQSFLAGYGLAQALPGPLFAFASFLGAASDLPYSALLLAFVASVAIFLPAMLLVLGALPYWQQLKSKAPVQQAMAGVNAAVVGVLACAFVQPVASSSIGSVTDFLWVLLAVFLLVKAKLSPFYLVAGALLLSLSVSKFMS
ncbi:chromate efflux transporter [Rheinheimera sp.]|uniref:chromate efflux transporter n=1 Tax=Rheinheimera sp. TaxID=1869214 RepID=UPI0027BAC906|nr:chromate efflux transporter [Rheinheimera sp.]